MEKITKIIVILAIVMLTAGCAGNFRDRENLILSEDRIVSQEGSRQDSKSAGEQEEMEDGGAKTQSQPISGIYVQVSGAVKRPGVYELPEGSRVFQALELAGGLTAEAEEAGINQAQVLADGQMIWILTKEEAAASALQPGNQQQEDGRVNLNTASREELMDLPGIGEAKAESILSWREAHGGFAQIEDLMKIEGIKEGVFSKIKDCVRVQ